MKANLITQPTRHNLRYANPVKRLRPFQNPTKGTRCSLWKPWNQGHLGTVSPNFTSVVFHSYRYARPSLSEIGAT